MKFFPKIIKCKELPQWIIESDRAAYHPHSNTIYTKEDQKFSVLFHEFLHFFFHKLGFTFNSKIQKFLDRKRKVTMQTIFDAQSRENQIIRFVFTPTSEKSLFDTIREHDLVSVINRSIPTNDNFLKNHGTLLFGDTPEFVLSDRFLKETFDNETIKLITKWIKLHYSSNSHIN